MQRQIARAPKSGALPYLLGRIYERRGETRRAETAYLRALEVEPTIVAPYVALGSLYANSGKYDQALQNIDEALRLAILNAPRGRLTVLAAEGMPGIGKTTAVMRALQSSQRSSASAGAA